MFSLAQESRRFIDLSETNSQFFYPPRLLHLNDCSRSHLHFICKDEAVCSSNSHSLVWCKYQSEAAPGLIIQLNSDTPTFHSDCGERRFMKPGNALNR